MTGIVIVLFAFCFATGTLLLEGGGEERREKREERRETT